MRDEFAEDVKRVIANRAGNRCACPNCGTMTSGPQVDPARAVNVGVAAHITAAAPGGPRYDPELRPKQRREASNGIWLCQTHAKLIDNDEVRYPSDLLREWKVKAEEAVLSQIGKPSSLMVLKAVVEECCLERGRGYIGIYNPTTRTIYAVYASITTSRSRGLLRLRWLGEPALEIDIDPGGRDTHRHIDLTEMHEGRRKLKLAWVAARTRELMYRPAR